MASPYRGKRNDYRALSEYWARRARQAEAELEALREKVLTPEEARQVLRILGALEEAAPKRPWFPDLPEVEGRRKLRRLAEPG